MQLIAVCAIDLRVVERYLEPSGHVSVVSHNFTFCTKSFLFISMLFAVKMINCYVIYTLN